jgi:hypothetical protein
MAFVIFARDNSWVMLAFMVSVTQVGTFSQYLSYASEVPWACAFDA